MVSFLDPALTPYMATFLFVFAVVFGLLSFMGKGEEGKKGLSLGKKVNAILAIAFGLFSVLYEPLVQGLQKFLPIAVIFLLLIFGILFIKKIFSHGKNKDTFPIVVTLAILLLTLIVLGDLVATALPTGLNPTDNLWIIGLAAIVLIFFAVYYHGGEEQQGPAHP